jgi:ABC-type nitrate/sulfonate/bicarbonate transport system ATPase subunit
MKMFSMPDGENVKFIEGVTLDIKHEEFVSIMSPSGCEKSTMPNIIAGLLEPSAGAITLCGHDTKRNARIGYMLQRDLLFPWRTIIDNACLAAQGVFAVRDISARKARLCLTILLFTHSNEDISSRLEHLNNDP